MSVAPVTDFCDHRIRAIAEEYYQRHLQYGVIHASVWLGGNLKDEQVPEFKRIQKEIAAKYGLK